MAIEFNAAHSRIYDFITFLGSRSCLEKNRNEYGGIDDCCHTLIYELFERTEYIRDRIDKFYFPELSIMGDFVYSCPFWSYNDEKSFLDALIQLSEENLKKTMLFSIIKAQEVFIGSEDIERIQEMIDELCMDEMKTFRFIQESTFSDGTKWKVFSAFSSAEKSRDEYVELMMEILPIFTEVYGTSAERVNEYGKSMIRRIKKEGGTAITNMWKDIYFNDSEDGYFIENLSSHLLISAASSLKANINYHIKPEDNYYVLGIELENGLNKLRNTYKDRRNEMVFFFKNLGDGTRYEILNLIAKGVSSNKEISNRLNLTAATISYHLGNLLNANLIKNVRNERGKKFEVNEVGIRRNLDYLLKEMKMK